MGIAYVILFLPYRDDIKKEDNQFDPEVTLFFPSFVGLIINPIVAMMIVYFIDYQQNRVKTSRNKVHVDFDD